MSKLKINDIEIEINTYIAKDKNWLLTEDRIFNGNDLVLCNLIVVDFYTKETVFLDDVWEHDWIILN